jgi:hypothetical protein
MKTDLQVVLPRRLVLDGRAFDRAINNGLQASAEAAREDFRVTTQTWKTDVRFRIVKGRFARTVATSNKIYGYVNDGTRPHIIRPRRARALRFRTPYRAKTRVGKISSRRGGYGDTVVYTRIVQHPGTKARGFAKAIQQKWRELLPRTMQRAIDSEVR